jgi:hypothetical protein
LLQCGDYLSRLDAWLCVTVVTTQAWQSAVKFKNIFVCQCNASQGLKAKLFGCWFLRKVVRHRVEALAQRGESFELVDNGLLQANVTPFQGASQFQNRIG